MKKTKKIINNKDDLSDNEKKVNKFDLLGLTAISLVNFKKAAELHIKLNINNIEDLYRACKEGRVRELKGWGEITESKIKSEIELSVLWLHTQCVKINSNSKGGAKHFNKEFLLEIVKEQAKQNLNV